MNIEVKAEATFNTEELTALRDLLGSMSTSDQERLDVPPVNRVVLDRMYSDIHNAFEDFPYHSKDN
jgi:hypothetical protein